MTVAEPRPTFSPERLLFDIRSVRSVSDELLPQDRLMFIAPGIDEQPSSELRLMIDFVPEVRARLDR